MNSVLRPYWYSSAHKASVDKKRKHRKRKGRMDLTTLSKAVSAAWKTADPEVIEYCNKLAKAEAEKYQEIVQAMNRQEKASKQQRRMLRTRKSSTKHMHLPPSLGIQVQVAAIPRVLSRQTIVWPLIVI